MADATPMETDVAATEDVDDFDIDTDGIILDCSGQIIDSITLIPLPDTLEVTDWAHLELELICSRRLL